MKELFGWEDEGGGNVVNKSDEAWVADMGGYHIGYSFKIDRTFEGIEEESPGVWEVAVSGTYTTKGKQLTINMEGNSQTVDYSVSGNTLKMTVSDDDGKETITFAKTKVTLAAFAIPASHTTLKADEWAEGSFTASVNERWYSFSAVKGTTYRVWWNDDYDGDGTYTAGLRVRAFYANGDRIFDEDEGWGEPAKFTAASSGLVYLKVTPYDGTGTFAIAYSAADTRPAVSGGDIVNAEGEAWVDNGDEAGERVGYVFTADGELLWVREAIPNGWVVAGTGTWSTSGTTLTTIFEGETQEMEYAVEGDTLTLTVVVDGMTLTIPLTRMSIDIGDFEPEPTCECPNGTVHPFGEPCDCGADDCECTEETAPTFSTAADLSEYLSTASGGKTASDPVPMKITDNKISWTDLLSLLDESDKYVELDLSASMGMGTFVNANPTDKTGRDKIASVILPDTTTTIELGAFIYCSSLESVTIPNSVTSIGRAAFAFCDSLASVAIPASVTSIGQAPFSVCTSLTAITVDPANTAYTATDGVLYNKAKTELIQYPAGKTDTSFTIPNSVTSIEYFAFDSCESLTSITIPNGVTNIGGAAFQMCRSLTSITIPDSVTSIGAQAFNYCPKLVSVTFEGTISSTGFDANAFLQTGDLRDKFYATDTANGTPGTYTRSGSTWTKQ